MKRTIPAMLCLMGLWIPGCSDPSPTQPQARPSPSKQKTPDKRPSSPGATPDAGNQTSAPTPGAKDTGKTVQTPPDATPPSTDTSKNALDVTPIPPDTSVASTPDVPLALDAQGEPVCKPIESILRGRCVHKSDCPAGLTPDLKYCAPVPECAPGTRYVRAKKACIKKGEECGQGRVWVPLKKRCVIKGAECRPGFRWLPNKERCALRGAECGNDGSRVWVPRKGRCVLKGTECDQSGMEWKADIERCVPVLPKLAPR